ncbi:hypothetical protein [Actinomadura sp. NEAU-AAG7]|uniref:hypothetical protein n=1 Tax=Actinomadura sp. NEAU-AAG7 TaxID=2839640 RepID=UPI001BE3D52C|nr:hypothetical protein [Actinomadura sp. NEAU-AAG7]MBT2213448.1 hypothetical protein [Actinomadura sp. NEAU-AAG7]
MDYPLVMFCALKDELHKLGMETSPNQGFADRGYFHAFFERNEYGLPKDDVFVRLDDDAESFRWGADETHLLIDMHGAARRIYEYAQALEIFARLDLEE